MLFNYIDYVAERLPVLNDIVLSSTEVTFWEGYDVDVNFSISIAKDGKPNEYTFNWYLNNNLILTQTSPAIQNTTNISAPGTYTFRCDVVSEAGTVSKTATLIANQINNSYTLAGTKYLVPSNNIITISRTGSSALSFNFDATADIYVIGGGGNGGGGWDVFDSNGTFWGGHGGAGGRGGEVLSKTNQSITNGTSYSLNVATVGSQSSSSIKGGTISITARGAYNSTGTGGIGAHPDWTGGKNGGNGTYVSLTQTYYGAGGGGGAGLVSNNYTGVGDWAVSAGYGGTSGGGNGGSTYFSGSITSSHYGGNGNVYGAGGGGCHLYNSSCAGKGAQGAILIKIYR